MPLRRTTPTGSTASPPPGQSRKPRLLVLTSTFPRWEGDSEPPFVFELSRRLADDYEIWVLAPHAPGARLREQIAGLNIVRYRYLPQRFENLAYEGGITAKLRKTPANYLAIPFFFLFQWLAVQKLLRDDTFDAIHAHWIIPQGLVALSSTDRMARPPVLCTSHGGDLYGLKGRLFARAKRFVLRKSTRFTVVSGKMRDIASAIAGGEAQIDVIPMGADIRERFVPPQSPRIERSLLFVGRLVEKKGLPYLLQALPRLLRDHPGLTLRIAGDGPDRPALEALVGQLGLASNVIFLGRTPNAQLPALYQSSEIVVFPSIVAADGDQEGLPVVPMEALGCECALVATTVPGTGDFLRDGENALVVPQRDASAIAERLRQLLDDPQLRQRLGRQGRISVLNEFDWSSIASRYRQIIDAMITTAHRPPGPPQAQP